MTSTSSVPEIVSIDRIENGYLVRFPDVIEVSDPSFALRVAALEKAKRDGQTFPDGEEIALPEPPKPMITTARVVYCANLAAVHAAVTKALELFETNARRIEGERDRVKKFTAHAASLFSGGESSGC